MINRRFEELIQKQTGPVVSIYLPTYKDSPDNRVNRLRYQNLLEKAELEYKEQSSLNVDAFFRKAREIQGNEEFWNQSAEGLALFISNELTLFYSLPGKVDEKIVVGSCFHLLPIMNSYEILENYYLLDISKDHFQAFILSNGRIRRLLTPTIYGSFQNVYEEIGGCPFNDSDNFFISSHNNQANEKDKVREKYFRYLDFEFSRYIRNIPLPIILFGSRENICCFTEIADKIKVYDKIETPLGSLQPNEISVILREKLLPKFVARMEKEIEEMKEKIDKNRGTYDLHLIEKESKSGRIENLFISKDYTMKALDNLIADISLTGGKIIVVDRDQTDFDVEIAAVFKY